MSDKDAQVRAERAGKPPAERQNILKNLFVDHDRFQQTTDAIARFHMPVNGGVHDVGSLFALAGDPRTGKSHALERYADRYPVVRGKDGLLRPVVYVDMPIGCRRRSMLDRIAVALNAGRDPTVREDDVEASVLNALREQEVQLLILDEYQEAFVKADSRAVQQCNGVVRKILNLRTLNVVAAGLVETYRMMESDRQLKGRGLLPHFIVTPYEWENKEERGVFRLLCDYIDDRLPFLEKSGLGKQGFAHSLYWVTDGIIGGLKDFVFAAGCEALNDGSPRITTDHCDLVWSRIRPVGMTFSPFRDAMSTAPRASALARPQPSGPSADRASAGAGG
ncbi:TniB family NTP-binding protein [Methylobacterium thuringiense]|uniref:TniB protein n=1 Tax=Methylobacterium thuringiense TaxID=1003091 RepID=A0ABQ4TIY0_9HYPH|nr:TniB family NTP-binding protein [Methylobacterium thuringiense]GJE54876.1 hypothetical protein EKPJFOCH_1361 [Methylobacterium thuringiense]